ncbi:Fluconazole resistance protein 1 [Exophiala xenobiotica]|uniref:Fluconazole resistance protein 1 n=1 Tax=Lithohypha guttulata TaxID=1690604 RepID=A0ABR0JWT1_9EURO|nr:Fluconazole resistance protein 1 [Lithohypha guttulata]KAK5310123.1 Fluconazole resistance protein 1 [Exophiala xenobiotica]
MVGNNIASLLEGPTPVDSGIRKRVCKACGRCRLKRSRCDGYSPCSRRNTDKATCVFEETKKSHDKVYLKRYGEMLESQQAQLIAGLRELYRRIQNGQGWVGEPLKERAGGTPLTHDILEALGALKQGGHISRGSLEENQKALQQELLANGVGFMQRETLFDTDSETDQPSQYGQLTHKAPSFANPFQVTLFPPTPPKLSPYPSSAHTAPPLKSWVPVEFAQPQQLLTLTPEFGESMCSVYDNSSDMSISAMINTNQMFQEQTAINPCMTTKKWDA